MPETVAVRKNRRRALYLVLLAALVLRLLMAAATEGYSYDVNCFTAWGAKLASEGPANFYSEDYFADYPPGYMYVLGLVAAVRDGFGIAWDGALGRMLLALVPALCDCGCAALIFSTAERYLKNAPAVRRLTLFAAFCPMMLFDTAVWKQVDGAFSLPLIACFVLLEDRRWLQSALLYGVALAIKPQALIAGPVLALCFLAGITRESDVLGRLRALGRTAEVVCVAAAWGGAPAADLADADIAAACPADLPDLLAGC